MEAVVNFHVLLQPGTFVSTYDPNTTKRSYNTSGIKKKQIKLNKYIYFGRIKKLFYALCKCIKYCFL